MDYKEINEFILQKLKMIFNPISNFSELLLYK